MECLGEALWLAQRNQTMPDETKYLDCLKNKPKILPEGVDLMGDVDSFYRGPYSEEEKVRDFIAGMTDDYFLTQARSIGCTVPKIG